MDAMGEESIMDAVGEQSSNFRLRFNVSLRQKIPQEDGEISQFQETPTAPQH